MQICLCLREMSADDLCNRVMISGKRHYWYFCGAVTTTLGAPYGPIILEKMQKYLWPISQKLGNSHQNYLDGQIVLQVRGKICIFDYGVNRPFKLGYGDQDISPKTWIKIPLGFLSKWIYLKCIIQHSKKWYCKYHFHLGTQQQGLFALLGSFPSAYSAKMGH